MKKFLKLMAVVVALITIMTGCSGNAKEIDAKALADQLVANVKYADTLQKVESDAIDIYFTLEDGVEVELYMGSGKTAEEVAVFTAPDEKTAAEQMKHVTEYLEDQSEGFRDYIPEEVQRIDNAVVEQKGKYVVLCVSDDTENAKKIIGDTFK